MDRAHLSSTPQTGPVGTVDADRVRDHHEQAGRTRCLTNLSPKRASDPSHPAMHYRPSTSLLRLEHRSRLPDLRRTLHPRSQLACPTHIFYGTYKGPEYRTKSSFRRVPGQTIAYYACLRLRPYSLRPG